MNSTANMIKENLGSTFAHMTGASHFVEDGNTLSFRVPSLLTKRGINYITIKKETPGEFTGDFTVKFFSTTRYGFQLTSFWNRVPEDGILNAIEVETGLRTSMGATAKLPPV